MRHDSIFARFHFRFMLPQVMNTALQEIEETNLAMSLQSRNQTQIMDELTGVMVCICC